MLIKQLSVSNIRNIVSQEIDFKKGINILWGKNGVGKTTLLEAIHILSVSKSFRTEKKQEIISFDKQTCLLKGRFKNNNSVKILLSQKQRKEIFYNTTKLTSYSELLQIHPTVTMSPEDIDIISGGNTQRIRFVDKILSTVDNAYLKNLKELKKIVKIRNKALSLGDKKVVLLWNAPLFATSKVLWKKRNLFFDEFAVFFNRSWDNNPSKHLGELVYKNKQTTTEEEFYKNLTKKSKQELILKTTLLGAHKDTLEFYLNKLPIKTSGSQGEKKLFLANLKFSEANYINEKLKKEPLLLLDDFFDKLDSEKINYLLEKLNKHQQSIITTTNHSIKSVFDSKIKFNQIPIHV